MRYLWLVFFAGFLYLSIVFITQNLDPIVIRFNLDELGLNFRFERPVFVPIFVTLALGILFCVAYFFTYHSQLRVLHRNQVMEVKRLKRLVLLSATRTSLSSNVITSYSKSLSVCNTCLMTRSGQKNRAAYQKRL